MSDIKSCHIKFYEQAETLTCANVRPLVTRYFEYHFMLSDGKVDNVGLIDDVEGFYNSGDVAMNPTYQGTGLKIKTFEALSYDKITMVHPHSMIGIYRPDTAPIFASTVAQEWVNFLDKIWTDRKLLIDIKKRNRDYLRAMEHFVENEYRRFFSNLKVS